MGMRDIAASPHAWLEFVTTQLKAHDNAWPTSLDSDEGLSEIEKVSRDSLHAKWQAQRDLYARDVQLAAKAMGLTVDVRGYPMLAVPNPVEEEPRNGFLSPEDAARVRAMMGGGGAREFGAHAQPVTDGALEIAANLLAPILDGLRERLEREREQSRAVGADGELRFKQIVSSQVRQIEDGSVQVFVLGLDMEGRVWCTFVYPSGRLSTWWRVAANS